ncbi:MAG: ammonium transporter [Deltaproteobacteria bacterium]|nr:ammonium transporter [Candidatus Anaeroferrophillacea bacterium]
MYTPPLSRRLTVAAIGGGILTTLTTLSAGAAEPAADLAAAVSAAGEAAAGAQSAANFVWICVAAFLVFFMQAGFAMVEAGFTRAKNVCNIIMKNLLDFSVGSLAFFVLGFGIMFGSDIGGFIGTDQFLLAGTDPGTADGLWNYAFWLFQCVFAATAATIVSGAMAERTKFTAYLIYSAFICLFIYPVSGHWIWGGGWLSSLSTPMIDFAGSTVVHSAGGWLALAGALLLGPREGKYTADGTSKAIPGHNILAGALGVFILWFGWFGFNPGSTTAANSSIGLIAVTTNLAAATGVVAAMITAWIRFGKPDVTMSLNGALAGLVAITAGCANVSPGSAVAIGGIAGIVVVISVEFIDKVLKIDDPVGAISVHGVCGALGTFCVGIFADKDFGGVSGLLDGGGIALLTSQIIGIAAVFAWSFVLGLILFSAIKATVGLRVSRIEELRGLDIDEHGNEAYYGFQIYTTE